MHRIIVATTALVVATLLGVLAPGLAKAQTNVAGITGPTFNFITGSGYLTSGDGGSIYFWGYGPSGGLPQYTGPTMIVNQGDVVTVNLTNNLPVAISIVFPGQEGVVATGDADGLLTAEAAAGGGTASYTFTAARPGTFTYQSGTRTEMQVEMGLVGALIVRPTDFSYARNPNPILDSGYLASTKRTAYGHPDTAYDNEYLFVLSEMDVRIHEKAEQLEAPEAYDTDIGAILAAIDEFIFDYHPVYWFINGRTATDTVFPDGIPWFPHQPYGSLAFTSPGEKTLQRWIGASKHIHPLHTHGANSLLIARDGALLNSGDPADGADLSYSENTFTVNPSGTWDSIYEWTGKGMGWDIYGPDTVSGEEFYHGTCSTADGDDIQDNYTGALVPDGFHDVTWEWCPDHAKEYPVTLPGLQDLTIDIFWSGSPYLGHTGSLPPGEGGAVFGGIYFFPWHSHSEVELTNFDIFIGGMLTLVGILPR